MDRTWYGAITRPYQGQRTSGAGSWNIAAGSSATASLDWVPTWWEGFPVIQRALMYRRTHWPSRLWKFRLLRLKVV